MLTLDLDRGDVNYFLCMLRGLFVVVCCFFFGAGVSWSAGKVRGLREVRAEFRIQNPTGICEFLR